MKVAVVLVHYIVILIDIIANVFTTRPMTLTTMKLKEEQCQDFNINKDVRKYTEN